MKLITPTQPRFGIVGIAVGLVWNHVLHHKIVFRQRAGTPVPEVSHD
ncbi:hypothetical protein [Amycolatopsis sp. cg9]